MKRIIIYFTFLFLFFCFPVSIFSQNINGNNNTVIIQMQGNNNSVQNSSINNNSNNSTYRSNNNYNTESSSSLFARYKQKNESLFGKSPTSWQIEFYNNGTYRYIRGRTIRYGTYTAMSNNKQNNTYTCIERIDNIVDQNGNKIREMHFKFKLEAINGIIMEDRIRLELVY